MNLEINIDKTRINTLNGGKNDAEITVDFSSLWEQIYVNYSHLHMDILLMIPVLTNEYMRVELSKEVVVADIVDKKVMFHLSYELEDDTSRTPYGEAQLRGYRLVV